MSICPTPPLIQSSKAHSSTIRRQTRFFPCVFLPFRSRFAHLCPQESPSVDRKLQNVFITCSPLLCPRWSEINQMMATTLQWECAGCNLSHWGFQWLFQHLHGAYIWWWHSRQTVLFYDPWVRKRNNVVRKWNVLVWKYCNANRGVEDGIDFTKLHAHTPVFCIFLGR